MWRVVRLVGHRFTQGEVLELNHLRSLVAVADAGAITEAASRLGITQPALTRRIQHLEQEFGALTPVG